MVAYPVLSNKERLWLVVLASLLGLMLGAGFLAAANSLFASLPLGGFSQTAPFVLLALFFNFSLKVPKGTPERTLWAPAGWKSAPIALAIATGFGFFLGRPPTQAQSLVSLSWLLVLVPVGEEMLFRGWCWKLYLRLFGNKLFSFSNSLPAVVVATSCSFSFWHLQNLQYFPATLTFFQVGYAFFVSLWLCSLRSGPGGVFAAILAHAALNASTFTGQWLSPF